MQKQGILKRISQATVAGLLLVQLFGFTLANQANAAGPIYVQFRTTASSAVEGEPNVPVEFMFTDGNGNNVSHGRITIYYEITGTADDLDYVFNNQPGVVYGSISVSAGIGDVSVNLEQLNEDFVENNESVVIQITSVFSTSNLSIGNPTVGVGQSNTFSHTILNDDSLPSFGNLNIINVSELSDPSVKSRTYPPGASQVQLGKWEIVAGNSGVTLSKLTLQTVNPVDNSVLNTLGTFGTLSLYDGATVLATGNYMNGDVVFSNFTSIIPLNNSKIYTLKGNTNPSGSINSNKPVAFVIKSDMTSDIEATDVSGFLLGRSDINYNAQSNTGPDETRFARSTVNNFHDAFPVIWPVSLGDTLSMESRAKLFKFIVINAGTRDLRVDGMNISVAVSGLVGGRNVSDFRLYEDNGAGGPGTYLAQHNITTGNTMSVSIPFNRDNDENFLLDHFVIAPAASRTFIVTADTTNILTGLTSGNVSISARIEGSAGWNGNSWNTGNLFYFYTPVGGSEIPAPPTGFSASDSYYQVVGGAVLTHTL